MKTRIAQDYNEKQQLTLAMEQWYSSEKKELFPGFNQLNDVTKRLSCMDTSFKYLLDIHRGELS